MANLKASDKLAKARAGLILDLPFFGSLVMRLALVPDESVKTAATNGKVVRYSPKYIDGLSLEQTKGLLCHEVMHCAMQHHLRRDARDVKKWNTACDYAIDPILVNDSKVNVPEPTIHPGFVGKSAEEIYTLLPDQGDGGGGQGQGQGQGQGGGGQQPPQPGDGQGDEESDQPNPYGKGGVEDPTDDEGKPLTPDAKNQNEQEWKVALAQAAAQAKGMGHVPAAIQRMVEEMLDPVVDWREVLRRFVDSAAKNDYRWSPANRKYLSSGIVLPSLRSQELGRIVVAIDTSGSIDRDALQRFASELNAMIAEYRAESTVIYCDAAVAGVDHFEAGEEFIPKPRGGGGTDFVPPFEYLEQENISPVCFIYFTDMECNSFPDEPAFPVLWAKWGDSHYYGKEVPFGEIIQL